MGNGQWAMGCMGALPLMPPTAARGIKAELCKAKGIKSKICKGIKKRLCKAKQGHKHGIQSSALFKQALYPPITSDGSAERSFVRLYKAELYKAEQEEGEMDIGKSSKERKNCQGDR